MTEYSICMQPGVLRIIYYTKVLLNILRFVIPILLIIKIVLSFYKGVLDPNDKEIFKKIKGKVIACIIVFLVPTFISLFMKLIEQIMGVDYYNGVSECYEFATLDYIELLETRDLSEEESKYLSDREQKLSEYSKKKLALKKIYESEKNSLEVGTYANNKNMIKCNSGSKYNTNLYNNVRTAGYKTRNGVVAAALYLSSHIDVHIPYFWSGGHFHSYNGYSDKGDNFMGVPNKWGCQVKMAFGGTESQKNGSPYPFGLDCSGFVAWSIFNGGYYTGDKNQEIYISTSSVPGSIGGIRVSNVSVRNAKGSIKPGDIAYKNGHVGLVVSVSNNGFTVAEERGYKYGLVITEHKYSKSTFTNIVLMDNFYNNYKKGTSLWNGFK